MFSDSFWFLVIKPEIYGVLGLMVCSWLGSVLLAGLVALVSAFVALVSGLVSLVSTESIFRLPTDLVATYAARDEDGKYVCTLCLATPPYSTAKSYNMKTHLQAKHDMSCGYQCQFCFKIMKTRNVLNRHMTANHPIQHGL